jgi:hypothetical protein
MRKQLQLILLMHGRMHSRWQLKGCLFYVYTWTQVIMML